MGRKRLVISIILSFFITVFCHPIYSGGDLFSSLKATKETKTSRIDFFAAGQAENRLEFLKSSNNLKFYSPEWYHNPQWIKLPGNGSIVEGMLKSKWQDYNLELKAVGSGDVTIFLSGPDKMHNNIRYPVLVDYKKLVVNGKVIFFKKKTQWHDRPFIYNIKVKDGEKLNVQITARRHHLRFSDFSKFYHLNYKMLFVIMVLSFLLSYKLVHYVAKFKILEHNSRIDIVFLCIFFVLLFVPMMKINSEQKSEQENRMLAKYPVFFTANGINVRFGAQFENWFNDRFWGRNEIMDLYTGLKYKLNKYYSNSKAFLIKDKWMFNWGELYKKNFSENDLKGISEGIEEFNKFCNQHHIKCYIEIVPEKLNFAKDKTFFVRDSLLDVARLKDYVKRNANFNIIYPINEFQNADKKDMTYFKSDHHWTEWGAYVGYLALMERVKKDFPLVEIVPESEFDIFYSENVRAEYGRNFWKGYTCNLLNLKDEDCVSDTRYKNYKHKNEKELQITLLPDSKKEFYYQSGNNKRAIVIGNSFAENFVSFLPYSFRRVKKIRTNIASQDNMNLSRWKTEILDFKTDIIVIVIQAGYCHGLQDLKR